MDFDWVCRLHSHGLSGYYWNEEPVVKMDGGGISALKEHLVIWESLRALKDNDLLSAKNLYGISVRTIFFLARRSMEILGMSEILGKLKKEKHNLLWQRSRDLAIKHNFRAVKTKLSKFFPPFYLYLAQNHPKKRSV